MRVYPVVHHLNPRLTLEQAGLAARVGADGVFLISHHGRDDELDDAVRHLAPVLGTASVGVNYLGLGFRDAFLRSVACGAGLVWADDPGVTSEGATGEAEWVADRLRQSVDVPTVFASVAFKYQRAEPDPARAAANAEALGFLPTTSGSGTGRAPDVAKVRSMAATLRGGRLAVASGLTEGNVASYAPGLTHCLVATSVCVPGDDHRFDEEGLRRFVVAAHAA